MYSTEEKRMEAIYRVLSRHGLTSHDISFLLQKKLFDSSIIKNNYDESDFSYREIIGLFQPKTEIVDITKIIGLEFENMRHLNDALLNIYRPESIFDNLGEFDFDKFYKSLNSYDSNYELIEKNGNYFVNGDGNHRTILMLFQYYLEYAKLTKENASQEQFDELKQKFQIKVPVIHLDHNQELISELMKMKRTYFEGFCGDFTKNILPKKYTHDCYLTQNEDKTYDIYCKGVIKKNYSSERAIEFIKNINNMQLNNNFFYDNGSFILYNKHIGVTNIPKDKVSVMDTRIKDLNLDDIGVDYFINVDFETRKISLDFAQKDYGAKYNVDKSVISRFQKENKDIFGEEEVIDYFGFSKEFHFDNLSMKDALKIIDKMKQLNVIATKKSSR